MRPREPFDAWSHAAGLFGALVGGAWLLSIASTPLALLAVGVYALAATLLFAASTFYHWTRREGDWPQRLDHLAIYAMIAGTYTPVCLLALPEELGRRLLVVEWGLAGLGLAINLLLRGGPHWVRLVIYLAMGWACATDLSTLRAGMGEGAFRLLVLGGALYTGGVVFYATDRTAWPGRRYGHEIWHVLVLLAAAAHFGAVATVVARG